MYLLTDEEQLFLNRAREILRGKELFNKHSKEILSQTEKLLICYKFMFEPEVLEKILSGDEDIWCCDKPGWCDGHLVSETTYETYLHRSPKRILQEPPKHFWQ